MAKNSKTYPQNGQNPSVIQLVEADFGTQTTEKLYGKLNPCLEMSKNQCKDTKFATLLLLPEINAIWLQK